MDHSQSTFACGCMASLDTIYCAKQIDALAEQDKPNVGFLLFLRDVWYKYQYKGNWTAVAMATIKPADLRTVVCVAPRGHYWECITQTPKETNGKINVNFSIRSLAAIEHVIYACGMGRHVLKRTGPGFWDEIGPGMNNKDEGQVVGFEDIDGFSVDDMYAVGWVGEIWRRDKGKWKRLDSPVTKNLNAVCCAPDGKVYVVGDGGVMLRGSLNTWDVLNTDSVAGLNLMDVAFFGDTVYTVTDFQIFKLQGDTLVPEDAFKEEGVVPSTCLHLLAAPDGIVSLGTKDLFRLVNGLWEQVV
jgi:hypothetical protein